MIPLIAGAAAETLKDKGTQTQIINVTKSATKWSLIIPGVIIGGALLFYAGEISLS